jgi:hypothetical protein
MSLFVDPPFALGQTLGVTSATQGENWVGVVKVFPDVNPRTGQVRSNRVKKCIAVRNASGATLFGKRGVSFVAGSQGAVVGYVYEDGRADKAVAGVADEYLPPAGVAANDVFWVTVEGPTDMLIDVATQPGQHIVGATINNITAATSSGNTGGFGVTATPTAALAAPTGSVVYYGRVAVTASQAEARAGVRVQLKEINA